MIPYIDKADVVAIIEKLKMDIGNIFNEYDEGFWEGRTTAFDDVICALDAIEVKEIDIDKEIEKYLLTNAAFLIGGDSKLVVHHIARYFFKLGLKMKGGDK